mmetsp:Transcript_103946/g.318428  ORF Transcript_103946/g.318428 Transcript_103946/m.318428 type:complete len:342 (+) Transcript_103946:137-1162(+)
MAASETLEELAKQWRHEAANAGASGARGEARGAGHGGVNLCGILVRDREAHIDADLDAQIPAVQRCEEKHGRGIAIVRSVDARNADGEDDQGGEHGKKTPCHHGLARAVHTSQRHQRPESLPDRADGQRRCSRNAEVDVGRHLRERVQSAVDDDVPREEGEEDHQRGETELIAPDDLVGGQPLSRVGRVAGRLLRFERHGGAVRTVLVAHRLEHLQRLLATSVDDQVRRRLREQPQGQHAQAGGGDDPHDQQPAPAQVFHRGVVVPDQGRAPELPHDEPRHHKDGARDPPPRRRRLGVQRVDRRLADADGDPNDQAYSRQLQRARRHGAQYAEDKDTYVRQ